jgi:molybdopterin converting factor small subunit
MPVVRLRGPLKRLAGDRAEHAIDGGSVGELLREIERAHPAAGGQETAVAADDRIDVLPAISGGER